MPNIRVGAQMHPQHTTYADFAGAVKQAEALGADTLWDWDHFFPLSGDPNGPHYEAWTLLTAMATLTTRAEVGCLVTCNSYRNPNLLADMARTVDHISGGRLILGIGAGWNERDYREFGYAFGTARTRLEALERDLPTILQRMEKGVPPPTRKIPVLIGGEGEKITLRLAAQYADIWNAFGPAEKYRHKNEVLDNWCRQVGRDPRQIERSVTVSAEEVPGKLDGLLDAGATHFILEMESPWDFSGLERLVRWRESKR